MKSCREVTTVVLDGTLDDAEPWRMIAVRLHLMMCRHCGAFRQYVRVLSDSASRSILEVTAELPAQFAATMATRVLSRSRSRDRDKDR